MPDWARTASATAAASQSRSRPGAGRTWIVISLDTSDCHSAADALPCNTVPVVIEARKVMMATTATSALPEIDPRGTIGDMLRARAGTCGRSRPRSTSGPRCWSVLLIDMQSSLMQYEPPGFVLVHQVHIMGCDHHGGSGLVQFDEQPQQTPPERRVDVAGRLIRQQQLRPRDDGARNRRSLFFAA